MKYTVGIKFHEGEHAPTFNIQKEATGEEVLFSWSEKEPSELTEGELVEMFHRFRIPDYIQIIIRAVPKCRPAPCAFRAGDDVYHTPTGENWKLATDEENGRVYPCGWPETIADAKDCVLQFAADDKERLEMLQTWAAEGRGHEHERDYRTRAARRQLSSESAS